MQAFFESTQGKIAVIAVIVILLFLIMRQPESHTCLLLSSSEERKCGAIVKAAAKGFNGKGGGRDDNARAIFPSTSDMDAFIGEICSQN